MEGRPWPVPTGCLQLDQGAQRPLQLLPLAGTSRAEVNCRWGWSASSVTCARARRAGRQAAAAASGAAQTLAVPRARSRSPWLGVGWDSARPALRCRDGGWLLRWRQHAPSRSQGCRPQQPAPGPSAQRQAWRWPTSPRARVFGFMEAVALGHAPAGSCTTREAEQPSGPPPRRLRARAMVGAPERRHAPWWWEPCGEKAAV